MKIYPLLKEHCLSINTNYPKAKTIERLIKNMGGLRMFPSKITHFGKIKKINRTKVLRKPKHLKINYPGHVVALDTIEERPFGKRRYIITFEDIYTRFAFALSTNSHASKTAQEFFSYAKQVFPFSISYVLTDNGSEFKKHFTEELKKQHLIHYHTYPRTPKINAHIERFNQTLKREFSDYDLSNLENVAIFNRKLMDYLAFYNTRRVHHAFNNTLSSVSFMLTLKQNKLKTLWTAKMGGVIHVVAKFFSHIIIFLNVYSIKINNNLKMNKQKTLIFSLLTLFLFASILIVYSWTEPVDTMPNGYNTPINTSGEAQSKAGEIGASIFRDHENNNYYFDAGGIQSVVAGKIITDNPTAVEDVPNSIATKGYVDNLLSDIDDETSLSNVTYIFGNNPPCPGESAELMRHWVPKTCGLINQYGSYRSCTTGNISFLGEAAPSCSFNDNNYHNAVHYCTADTSEAVLCAKAQDALFGNKHTENQCTIFGGTIVTIEGNVKICKFPVTTQFKSYDGKAYYECPTSWTKYKTFVTTKTKTWTCSDLCGNLNCMSSCSWSCTANPTDERVFSNKPTIDACARWCTWYKTNNGTFYPQAEVIEAGCY